MVANVVAVDADRPGYLQVFPTGQAALESSSTLNTDGVNQTIANATFAPLSDSGKLTVYVIFETDVVIDIAGYFMPASMSAAGRLIPLTPSRILDTRIALGWKPPPPTTTTTIAPRPTPQPPPNPGDTKNCSDFATYGEAKAWFDYYYPYYGDVARLDADNDGIPCESLPGGFSVMQSALVERVEAGNTFTLKVAGRGGVPQSGVSAVILNVTAANTAAPGYVQVAPTPVVEGSTSSLNFAAGRTVANLVVVPLGKGGSVDLYTITQVDLIADVVGYFTDKTAPKSGRGRFVPIAPNRQLDSRELHPHSPLPGGTVTSVDLRDISPHAIAIAGNLTATGPTQPGYLQLAAPPIGIGGTSNLNMSYPGQTVANAIVSPVANGHVELYNLHPTHEILDVTGWFTSTAPPPPPTTTTPTTTTPTTTAPPTSTTTPKATTTTTTQATTTTTVAPEPEPQIAFTRANQIYTINPDGTGEIKLTSADKNYQPRWSPDGNRIAFVHEVAGDHQLWVMNADGSNKLMVDDDVNSKGAAWSPDGGSLAYGNAENLLTQIKSTPPFGSPQLRWTWDTGSGAENGVPVGITRTPTWSATENVLFFYGGDAIVDHAIKGYDIGAAEGGHLWTAFGIGASCCGFGNVADPAASPHGPVLGVTVTMDGEAPIIRLLTCSSEVIENEIHCRHPYVPFTTYAEDAQLAFSKADERVALMNDAVGVAQIYIADADGTNRRFLTNGYSPDWQPQP